MADQPPSTTLDHTPARIGALAEALGLNPKTIRYYEQIGLLPTPARSRSGYRQYDAADRERLAFILKARAIGFALDEIRQILALSGDGQQPCEHVRTLLGRRVAAIDAQVRALGEVRRVLVALQERAAETVRDDACVCGIIEDFEPAHGEPLPARASAPTRRVRPPAPRARPARR